MTLNNQVPSLELSQKLDALLGDERKESLYEWKVGGKLNGSTHSEKILPKDRPRQMGACDSAWQHYPAYTTAELGEIIAKATDGEYTTILNEEGAMGYRVYEPIIESKDLKVTRTGYKLEVISNENIMDITEANARAKMLCFLLENKIKI